MGGFKVRLGITAQMTAFCLTIINPSFFSFPIYGEFRKEKKKKRASKK